MYLVFLSNNHFDFISIDLEYWYKWIVSYVYIQICRRFSKKRFDLYDMWVEHDPYKVCFLPPPEEIALESPLPENQLTNVRTIPQFYFHINVFFNQLNLL